MVQVTELGYMGIGVKDLETVLQGYELTEEERSALKGWQVRKLYDMGANPLLLLVSSMASGQDLKSYVTAMNP